MAAVSSVREGLELVRRRRRAPPRARRLRVRLFGLRVRVCELQWSRSVA